MPGLCFVSGLYSSDQVNDQLATFKRPINFALAIGFTLLLVPAISLVGEALGIGKLGIGLSWVTSDATGSQADIHGILQGLASASLLTTGACVLGVQLGRLGAWLIEKQWIKTELLHGWPYDYISKGRIPSAHVLTNIESDGNRAMYEGVLSEIRTDSTGALLSVRLVLATRRSVSFSHADENATTPVSTFGLEQDLDLHIPGSQIANIAIDVGSSALNRSDLADSRTLPESFYAVLPTCLSILFAVAFIIIGLRLN